MLGKHSKEELEIRQVKDELEKVYDDITKNANYSIKVIESIKQLNESNDYANPSVRKRKISELCDDAIYNIKEQKNRANQNYHVSDYLY